MTQPEYEKRIEDMVKAVGAVGYGYRYPDGIRFDTGGRSINGSDPSESFPVYDRVTVVALLLKQRREVLEEAAQHRYSHYANGWEMCMCGKKSNKWADHIITLGGSDD